ncbi:MAG: hypothetical protein TE42_10530 [Candidatus Synechococcus spongiarum SP3]|uniref:Uncharacterized protein n=1 Tax=Candidatus Synechococcus spongiarum SP3 TaxID=1604020 RepID=A0A0G2J3Y0_9SYNE|nr:MAG: hypothetical protein TE42_10530 [Candidatus Synechococcus spongiarum SP3]
MEDQRFQHHWTRLILTRRRHAIKTHQAQLRDLQVANSSCATLGTRMFRLPRTPRGLSNLMLHCSETK